MPAWAWMCLPLAKARRAFALGLKDAERIPPASMQKAVISLEHDPELFEEAIADSESEMVHDVSGMYSATVHRAGSSPVTHRIP